MIQAFRTFSEFRKAFPKLQSDPLTKRENVFVTLTIPTESQLREIHSDARCLKCEGPMSLVASDRRDDWGALLLRCSLCFEDHWFFVTTEKTTSPDVALFQMSPKRESTKSLFSQFKCRGCQEAFQPPSVDPASYDMKTIIAGHMRCSSCRKCMNIIFWDPPLNYYKHMIDLGDAALAHVPEAAHVFFVAALENYLQKCFLAASDFNKFLVKSQKLGFQDLRAAKDIYAEFFAIDLSNLAGDKWALLKDAVRVRNMIVHNAGHDKNFTPICITQSTAREVREHIVEFVENLLHPEIRRRMVD